MERLCDSDSNGSETSSDSYHTPLTRKLSFSDSDDSFLNVSAPSNDSDDEYITRKPCKNLVKATKSNSIKNEKLKQFESTPKTKLNFNRVKNENKDIFNKEDDQGKPKENGATSFKKNAEVKKYSFLHSLSGKVLIFEIITLNIYIWNW